MSTNHFQSIINFYHQNRRLPSYQEILELTGLKSKNAVFKLINKMMQQKLVAKDEKGKLIPKKIIGQVRILGEIQAGFPSPAEEELIDTMSLDEYLINNRQATYMLKVSGDSMIDEGIKPGDLVLVERGRTPFDGDIVIAEVDGHWTMKYFKKQGNKVFLLAANKKYPSIFPQEELKIAAVVVALVRKYK